MKSNIRTLLVLTTGLVLGLTLAIGHGVFADKNSAKSGVLPLEELRSFTEVLPALRKIS